MSIERRRDLVTVAKDFRIAIIGTGFSGLCLGIHLKKLGMKNFVIFEKAEGIGGTWRENTYPGAECDIPSALYSFSFERNPNWTHKWSEQPEILEYLEHCAKKHDLYPHIKFGLEVRGATFDEEAGQWTVETSDGVKAEFDVVVSGVGQLHRPRTPEIKGADTFKGPTFHSAKWDHSVSLEGKRVGSIGNAASAVQFLPQIAPETKHLTVFQRSANWILPKNDREYTGLEKMLGTLFPPLTNLYRLWIFIRGWAFLYPLMNQSGGEKAKEQFRDQALEYLEEKVSDPELRKTLTPTYPIGAKRILFSDDILDALTRDNVDVVTSPISHIVENGLVTEDGTLHELDVMVYATGFDTTSFLTPMRIEGRKGVVLNELWAADGAEAYLGITHNGFPNFFMMYGPNTNLGHNSIVIMIEAQTRYILSCLNAVSERKAKWLDVKAPIQKSYNEWVQERLSKMIWASVNRSWYKTESGKITNNWVGRTTEYRKRTKALDPNDYEFV